MKISVSAVTALLLFSNATAFTAVNPLRRMPTILSSTATKESGAGAETSSDVSVPYDAAARLAYDEWRATYNKGDFDAARFESFRSNYQILTVTNIAAAKKAKDAGEDAPKKLDLNEFADMTFEEYEATNSGGAATEEVAEVEAAPQEKGVSDVSLMETVMAGSAAQSAASLSLEEAAAALAEEEQVRTVKGELKVKMIEHQTAKSFSYRLCSDYSFATHHPTIMF